MHGKAVLGKASMRQQLLEGRRRVVRRQREHHVLDDAVVTLTDAVAPGRLGSSGLDADVEPLGQRAEKLIVKLGAWV